MTTTRRTAGRPARRIGAAALAALLALSVAPLAGAADDPPVPVADPIAEDGFCDGAPSNNPFTDIGAEPAGTRAVILCLVAAEITTGTTPTTYTPGGTVTRRQMALFIQRLADLANENARADLAELPEWDGTSDYSDVDADDDPGAEAIGRLSQADIVGGFPDGTYRPNAPVSRRQMAAFVNRLQEFLTGERFEANGEYFDDLDGESAEARDNLNAMAEVGIFQGDGQGNVTPGGDLTRRQMANILMRHAQVNYSRGIIDSPFNPLATGVTVLPELIRAERLNTVTEADATASNPKGTRVRFVFDEEVEAPTAAAFKVYNRSGGATASTAGAGLPAIESHGRSVIARFDAIDTAALAEDLTVAAVARGAVRDADGGQNPEGSAPIGVGGTFPLHASRTTTAPDLLAITGFRAVPASTFPPSPSVTAIDVTFDQPAYVQNPLQGAGFQLIGRTAGTGAMCTGPNALQTTSGGTSPGGSGTATFTITCPDNGTPWTAANTARVLLPAGAVHSTQTGGSANVVQVTQSGAAQDVEGRPNLVSVFREPAQSPSATQATVVFTFDRAVELVPVEGEGRFAGDGLHVYRAGASQARAVSSPAPAVIAGSPNTVRATFPAAVVEDTVGGFVLENTVRGAGGGFNNRVDEAGVTNPATYVRTPGRTAGPDLLGVALSNPGGSGWVATYTFDAPVADGEGPYGTTNAAALVLYAADGTRLQCTNADAKTYGTGENANRVSCNAFTITGGGAATSAQIGNAVLGTVTPGAAATPVGTGFPGNPEGGVATTGGTGTPAT